VTGYFNEPFLQRQRNAAVDTSHALAFGNSVVTPNSMAMQKQKLTKPKAAGPVSINNKDDSYTLDCNGGWQCLVRKAEIGV
jgi:hypothetical protein